MPRRWAPCVRPAPPRPVPSRLASADKEQSSTTARPSRSGSASTASRSSSGSSRTRASSSSRTPVSDPPVARRRAARGAERGPHADAPDFCVDVKDGEVTAEQLQLWQCAPGNPNQVWHTVFIDNF